MVNSDKIPIKFNPSYRITPLTASNLMVIEAVRQEIEGLPVTPKMLATLRETARLYSTHYSTLIEGNQLEHGQVVQVIEGSGHFPGRERDEREVKGYYAALEELERVVANRGSVSEKVIATLHAFVEGGGRKSVKPTPYRDGQNVIRNSITRDIVYMPPEAHDVPGLMKALTVWINEQSILPVPLIAAVAHYQFATIHPWYDGNGRTARLLATLLLHLGGYGLKGLYALEEYYARDLISYYGALAVGPSHNYYFGRAEADITPWIDYFIAGVADSFLRVKRQAVKAAEEGGTDLSLNLRDLDASQRKALSLFRQANQITANDVGTLFQLKPRTASKWCAQWVENGFLIPTNPSRKARKYALARKYRDLIW